MRITLSLRPVSTRIAAVCVGALAATGIALVTAGGATADDYPGQAEIEAARQAATSQAATVGDLDAAVAKLERAQHDAEAGRVVGELAGPDVQVVTGDRQHVVAQPGRPLDELVGRMRADPVVDRIQAAVRMHLRLEPAPRAVHNTDRGSHLHLDTEPTVRG